MFKSSLKSKLITIIGLLFFVLAVYYANVHIGSVSAQQKIFSAEELSQFDGRDGQPAYYAFEGKVYDVTGSKLWKEGEHFGLQAGTDLTGQLDGAPHGTEVFAGFEVVGQFESAEMQSGQPEIVMESPTVEQPTKKDSWYQGRIEFLGFSILGWTGILLAVFFILTFATCFAMPWAKLPLPWKGKRIGPDPLDQADRHLPWTAVHKHFVWVTVILGIIHGVIGFMQMILGIYL